MNIKKTAIFVLVVVMFSFLYIIVEGDITGQATSDALSIDVDSLSCRWNEDHFEACGSIAFSAPLGHYAKGFIGGGEPIVNSPKITSSPAIYCQSIGETEGKKAFHAYLYNSQGVLKKVNINNLAECKKEELPTIKSKKKFFINTWGEFRSRPRGEGSVDITGFNGIPISCKITGGWITNNMDIGQNVKLCHKATGTLEGFYGHGEQYVMSDPQPFAWQGIRGLFIDPRPKLYEGYVMYANTCDRLDYSRGRYYSRVRVSDVYDGGLTLTWEYFDDDMRPKVEFNGEIECDIAQESLPTKKQVEFIEPVLEPDISQIMDDAVEDISEDEIVGIPIRERKQTFLQRFVSFFTLLFKN